MSHYICKHCHQRYDECSCQPTLSDAGDGNPEFHTMSLVRRLRELEAKLPSSNDDWVAAKELQQEAATHLEELVGKALKQARLEGARQFRERAARLFTNGGWMEPIRSMEAIISMPLVEE